MWWRVSTKKLAPNITLSVKYWKLLHDIRKWVKTSSVLFDCMTDFQEGDPFNSFYTILQFLLCFCLKQLKGHFGYDSLSQGSKKKPFHLKNNNNNNNSQPKHKNKNIKIFKITAPIAIIIVYAFSIGTNLSSCFYFL